MESQIPEPKKDNLSKLFVVSMWWRIFYGAIRLLGALFLVKKIGLPVSSVFEKIFRRELIDDPSDLTARVFSKTFGHTHYMITHFLVLYLIFWAVIDIWLSVDMLRQKLFAFSVSMYLISFFLLYEIFRAFHTHSRTLTFFITIDAIIFWLIIKEYRKLRRQSQRPQV